ncbi:hypothetical protein J6590_037080 [Homalodisca vitripennis]|nr:hypothetical protein J6590_037080 [Homalodisca vitripennis]
MTKVTVCNDKHSGVHPVTMRTLSSPLQRPATVVYPYPPHHRLTAVPPASRTLAYSTPGPDVVPPSKLPYASPSTPLQPASENTLLIENARLKAEVAKLKTEVKVILDHLIESDQRLLQFTDTIFISSKSVTPLKKSCTNYVNASAQTEELPGVSENNIGLVQSKKIADLEKEIQDLKRPCRECKTFREEIKKNDCLNKMFRGGK